MLSDVKGEIARISLRPGISEEFPSSVKKPHGPQYGIVFVAQLGRFRGKRGPMVEE